MVRTSQLDRYTAAGYLARHPVIILPPNLTNHWNTATAAAGLTSAGGVFAAFPNRSTFVTAGGAVGNVTVACTVGAGFVSTMTLAVEVNGFDENWVPAREVIYFTGNGAATQAVGGKVLFSQVNAINYSSVGAVAVSGSAATFTVGTGDGVSATQTILIPNLLPHLPPASITLFLSGSNATLAASYVVVSGVDSPDGKGGFRAWKPATNYGAVNTCRLAFVIITGQSAESIEL